MQKLISYWQFLRLLLIRPNNEESLKNWNLWSQDDSELRPIDSWWRNALSAVGILTAQNSEIEMATLRGGVIQPDNTKSKAKIFASNFFCQRISMKFEEWIFLSAFVNPENASKFLLGHISIERPWKKIFERRVFLFFGALSEIHVTPWQLRFPENSTHMENLGQSKFLIFI